MRETVGERVVAIDEPWGALVRKGAGVVLLVRERVEERWVVRFLPRMSVKERGLEEGMEKGSNVLRIIRPRPAVLLPSIRIPLNNHHTPTPLLPFLLPRSITHHNPILILYLDRHFSTNAYSPYGLV